MTGYSSFQPPPEGPLLDELRNREIFTREMHGMIAGLLVPIAALRSITETVDQLDLENADLEDGIFPIIEGVAPVALLWKHACQDEEGHRGTPQWYLVPLLSPAYTGEDDQDMTKVLALGAEFISALVGNATRWSKYVERWGSMP